MKTTTTTTTEHSLYHVTVSNLVFLHPVDQDSYIRASLFHNMILNVKTIQTKGVLHLW